MPNALRVFEASEDTTPPFCLQMPWATQSSEPFLEPSSSLSCFHCTYPSTVMPFCWKNSFTLSTWSAEAIDGTNFAFESLYSSYATFLLGSSASYSGSFSWPSE